MPTVFLSYRHESEEHAGAVRSLAHDLEVEGLNVVLDALAQEREFCGGGPDVGWPALFLRGASGSGKTAITEQLLGNALRMPGLCCGRFDFKGTTRLREELGRFALHLGVPSPTGDGITDGLNEILRAVLKRQRPTLLIFDTFEQAGEATNWMSKTLLTALIPPSVRHVRTVIVGQVVPHIARAAWALEALGPIDLDDPTVDDWYRFGGMHWPELTRDLVDMAYGYCRGAPPLLSQLLGPGVDYGQHLPMLAKAQGEPAALALVLVDITFSGEPPIRREHLRAALEAAAVTHWTTPEILASLLELSAEDAAERLEQLRQLTIVETFPARGENACNVHEQARLALVQTLARQHRLPAFATRAAAVFTGRAAHQRIERAFHLAISEPVRGATEIELLCRQWLDAGRIEECLALAAACDERASVPELPVVALARALVTTALLQIERIPAAHVEALARRALALFRELADDRQCAFALTVLGQSMIARDLALAREAHAEALRLRYARLTPKAGPLTAAEAESLHEVCISLWRLADVCLDQEDLVQARASATECLEHSRRLVAFDPGSKRWQRSLYVSLHLLSKLDMQAGQATKAEGFMTQALDLGRQLVAYDPRNTRWQRDVSVATFTLGDLALARHAQDQALALFSTSLAMNRQRAALDPANSTWQRDLFVTMLRVGDLEFAARSMQQARASLVQALETIRRLVALDPVHDQWQRDLFAAVFRVADLELASEATPSAKTGFEEALEIARRLVVFDPANGERQSNVALTLWRLAGIDAAAGQRGDARHKFVEALGITRALTAHDAAGVSIHRTLCLLLNQVGGLEEDDGKSDEAQAYYEEALAIARRLVVLDDTSSSRRTLSQCLGRIGRFALGRQKYEQGRTALVESLELERQLADEPDQSQSGRWLWWALNGVGNAYSLLENREEACSTLREALELAGSRLAALPEDAVTQDDVAHSLKTMGELPLADGQLEGVLGTLTQLRELLSRLVERNVDTTAIRRALFLAHADIAEVSLRQKNVVAARKGLVDGLTVVRGLMETEPERVWWRHDVSVFLERLGRLEMSCREFDAAERAFVEGIVIIRDVLASEPRHTGALRQLALLLDQLGRLHHTQGKPGALSELTEAFVSARQLIALEPENRIWENHVLELFTGLAALGQTVGAHADLREVVEIACRRLAESPDDTACRRSVPIALLMLGELSLPDDQLEGWRHTLVSTLHTLQELVLGNGGMLDTRRGLYLAFGLLAELDVRQRRVAEARQALTDGLLVVRGLVEAEPATIIWRHDVSVFLERLARLELSQGEFAAGELALTEGIAIVRGLVASEPEHAAVLSQLALLLYHLGTLHHRQGKPEAFHELTDALENTRRVAALQPSDASWVRRTAELETRLAALTRGHP